MPIANHIKKGMAIQLDGQIYIIKNVEHHKPGKGAAVVRTKLKGITKNITVEKIFRSSQEIKVIEVNKISANYSYDMPEELIFILDDTYEQVSILKENIQNTIHFMKPGMQVHILMHQENPIDVILPNFIELKVEYAEDAIRGDTTTNPTKEVILETGGKIQVPLFIKINDVIKVDLRTFSYIERV